MLYRFKNNTEYIQQINLIDGNSVNVEKRSSVGGYADLDVTMLYKEELERVKKFFTINPVASLKK